MGEPAINHTRRRSSSLATAVPASRQTTSGPAGRQHGRSQSVHIPEVEEGESDEDEEDISDSSGRTDPNFELDDMNDDERLEDDEETGLTGKDRGRRRRRKRRHTRMDDRVVDAKYTKEEEAIAKQSFVRASLINVLLIGLWYLFSISISVYNKWMFGHDEGEGSEGKALNFPFPLFTTCMHMIVQFCLASAVLFFLPSFRPRHDSLNLHAMGNSQQRLEPIDPEKPLMTRWFYLTRIGPCGIATGMDIGLGNTSLKFISLTFFTMCKSSVLGFVLLFAFLFRLEKPSWKLGAIILTMTVGVVMMVAGETAFNALGFILIMMSSLSSGFRWSLTQILLLRHPATSNPFSSIFLLAPVMFVSLLVIALPVEGVSNVIQGFADLTANKGLLLGVLILLFPGCLAFLMTTSEFALLKRTSVVTLSICGIFKEVVTISAASIVFDDQLTPVNLSGLVVTIGSIAAYNYIKIKKMRDEARMEAHFANDDYQPVLSAEPEGEAPPAEDGGPRGAIAGASTGQMLRSALSVLPPDRVTITDSPVRQSPVKRPGDME